jgi:heme exporter protein C
MNGMKIFRSNIFLCCLGLALATQVFIAFETPIGGSFNDVVTLEMNLVSDQTPVKATIERKSIQIELTTIGSEHPDSISLAADAQRFSSDADTVVSIYSKDIEGKEAILATIFPASKHSSQYMPNSEAPILPSNEIETIRTLKQGDVLIANVKHKEGQLFPIQEIIRVNPIITFPMIQGLGELGRNLLFHVPMSMVAFIAFFLGTIYSILYLVKKDSDFDRRARAASAGGFLFTALATATGSIWARFSWGTFWNWDPRETSIFILLLIYGAYFMLRSLLEESEDKKARIAAVYNIIAFVSVPFLMFVVPRITQSLHPGGGGTEAPIINLSGQTHTDRTLLNMHWISVVLFLFVFLWIKDIYTRILRIQDERAEEI